MISNFKPNYYKKTPPKPKVFVRVENDSTSLVKVVLKFTLKTGTLTKESDIIKSGTTKEVAFPTSAKNLCINVLNESNSHKCIYNHSINDIKRICLKVNGSTSNLSCNEYYCWS